MKNEIYTIYYRYSKSKKYTQLLELSSLAYRHKIQGKGKDVLHIVDFTVDQIDLMAQIYILRTSIGFNIRKEMRERISVNHMKVFNKLIQEGYIKKNDYDYSFIKMPTEHHIGYNTICQYITNGKYKEAINHYYKILEIKPFNELYPELLYLKRLAGIELAGRDILALRNKSSYGNLISNNIWEYCSCIDLVIKKMKNNKSETPIDILIETVPIAEEIVERRQNYLNKSVKLINGKIKILKNENITKANFSVSELPKGRLFDRYTNPFYTHYNPDDAPEEVKLVRIYGLWVTYSPTFINSRIKKKGLYLTSIDAYIHKKWNIWNRKRNPEFEALSLLKSITKNNYFTCGISYTGRTHKIKNVKFYEVNLHDNFVLSFELKKTISNAKMFHALKDMCEEILRESENLLREKHGLPRIGEGWVSEMELYGLINKIFPTAEHHVRPSWLKPFHLDIYIAEKELAFEYHGKQHYEPVAFFGGGKAYLETKERDTIKQFICKKNKVKLIIWNYLKPITPENLLETLEENNIYTKDTN